MEALFVVLLVGGLALGVYELGQTHLRRSHLAAKRKAAEQAMADGPSFKATAKLFKAQERGRQASYSGIAIDTDRELLTLLCPGPSRVDSYLEGRIDRSELDEAIHCSLLRESVRAYLRRKLRQIETPTAADGVTLTKIIDEHHWASDLIQRPLRSGLVYLDDLVEAEVIADGRSIAKAARDGRGGSRGDTIVRQRAARRMANRNLVGLHLKILVNDLDEPLFLLDLSETGSTSPQSAEASLQQALQWFEILRVVLTRQQGAGVTRPFKISKNSSSQKGRATGPARRAGTDRMAAVLKVVNGL